MSPLPKSGVASELPTVARCEKCGREFVSPPTQGRDKDPWPPQDKWRVASKAERQDMEPCWGKIVILPDEPLHLMTQRGQPYGSTRRCCEECGRMCWPGMAGSAKRWTDDPQTWIEDRMNCRAVLTDGERNG